MIVPMKKITLLVLKQEREAALAALRETGVMHVEKREASSQEISDLQALISRIDQATSVLTDIGNSAKTAQSDYTGRVATVEIVDEIITLRDARRDAFETIARIEREFERLTAWGDVSPADFDALAEKGIYLFPFEMSVPDYTSLPESVRSIVVNRDKKNIRCLIWGEDDLLHADMPAGARELVLPEESSRAMREQLDAARKSLSAVESELARNAAHLGALHSLKAEVLKELEFESIRAGMPLVDLGTAENGKSRPSLVWLTGFVPSEDEHKISAAAKNHGWAYMSEEPSEEDIVPTKIRNNRFVNLISPLLDFLGTVPGYREMDISLWFLLFFGIFFAMIFGDGGYGSLLVLLSLGGIFSNIRKKKKAPTALFMLLYLGIMTVAWGTLTCTWFGIPSESLPLFLRSIALPAFSNENPDSVTNIKVFCFTLGLIQISLAHVIGIVRNRSSLKLLGDLGSLLMTIGMYFVVLNLVVDAEKYPLGTPILAMIGAGFLLNFVFINYSGSFGGGILESLKNIITMVLGVVNMFGDIMSYIRLWAVGLAGSAISSTVNTMAGPMLGGFIIFAGIILLFFGHGLNTVMNVLSVLVHGVRLNTLEFSNHLGLTWSGFKYEPFSETVRK